MNGEPDALRHFLDLVGQAAYLEYEFVFYYPQILESLTASGARPRLLATLQRLFSDRQHHLERFEGMVHQLYLDSTRHLGVTTGIIERLGDPRVPSPQLEPLPEELDLRSWFEKQLEREKLAGWVYEQAAPLTSDKATRTELAQFAQDERRHAEDVERILSLLK